MSRVQWNESSYVSLSAVTDASKIGVRFGRLSCCNSDEINVERTIIWKVIDHEEKFLKVIDLKDKLVQVCEPKELLEQNSSEGTTKVCITTYFYLHLQWSWFKLEFKSLVRKVNAQINSVKFVSFSKAFGTLDYIGLVNKAHLLRVVVNFYTGL